LASRSRSSAGGWSPCCENQHVEIDRFLDVVCTGVEEGWRHLTTGVIDEDVEAAELIDGALNYLRIYPTFSRAFCDETATSFVVAAAPPMG
jgi:hypothetical protein